MSSIAKITHGNLMGIRKVNAGQENASEGAGPGEHRAEWPRAGTVPDQLPARKLTEISHRNRDQEAGKPTTR